MRCVRNERGTGWCTMHEVKCYENHAQDARVREIQGGGMPHGRCEQRERNGDERQQSADTMETERTTYSIGGGQVNEVMIFAEEFAQTLDTMHNMRAVVIFAPVRAAASRRATASSDAPTVRTHTTES